jgi:predicted restriction endonuclease
LKFRRNKSESDLAIRLSGNCCVVCGYKGRDPRGNLLIIGAHVRRLNDCNFPDSFTNIVGLCGLHHLEFDTGVFTFDHIKNLSIFRDEQNEYHRKSLRGSIKHLNVKHLIYHRRRIFEDY